jgi:putative ABC transport system permease protein
MWKLFRRPETSDLIRELEDELRFHVDELTDEYTASGWSLAEARRRALVKLGNPQRVTEQVRENSWRRRVADLCQDLCFAVRSLRRAGRITFVAVAALALGIGFSATVFSVVHNGVLHPFPYRSADRLANIVVSSAHGENQGRRGMFSLEEIAAFRKATRAFEDVVGYSTWFVRYVHDGGAEVVHGGAVTSNAMDFFGMRPILGRGLSARDSQPDAPPVVLLNYRFWTDHFNADPRVLGSTMLLAGRVRTVVGVMPPRFQLLGSDLYLPVPWQTNRLLDENEPDDFFANAIVRRSVSLDAAGSALTVMVQQLARVHPKDYPDHPVAQVKDWSDALFSDFKRMFLLLAAAVGLLLVISCSNAAGLLLVHASSRQKEMAVRTALGAGRRRLVRQFLAESMVLAGVGCIMGCLLAWLALQLLANGWISRNVLCMEADVRLDRSTLILAVCISFLATIAAGIAPAIASLRGNVQEQLGSSGIGVHASFRGGGFRSGLVIGQVALSVVLLVFAGLVTRTFLALTHVDFGMSPANLLSGWISLSKAKYKSPEQRTQYIAQLLGGIETIPGVLSASESVGLPIYGGPLSDVTIPDKPHPEPWVTMFEPCSANYFHTLGIQLLSGRLLSDDDVASRRPVAVVNRTLARSYFGDQDPIGKQIKFNRLDEIPQAPRNVYFSIVGVVTDFTNSGVQSATKPEAFVPYSFISFGGFGILVRTAADPNLLMNSIRRVMWNLDPDVSITEPLTLVEYLARYSYAKPRFGVLALAICAGVGLLLSLIGIFTITAYTVSLLTHEIGIRMALGARPADVLGMVLRKCLRLVGAGIVVGIVASLALAPALRPQLWGVSTFDGITFLAVALLLLTAGMLASYLPALKAVQVDPNAALRAQ